MIPSTHSYIQPKTDSQRLAVNETTLSKTEEWVSIFNRTYF